MRVATGRSLFANVCVMSLGALAMLTAAAGEPNKPARDPAMRWELELSPSSRVRMAPGEGRVAQDVFSKPSSQLGLTWYGRPLTAAGQTCRAEAARGCPWLFEARPFASVSAPVNGLGGVRSLPGGVGMPGLDSGIVLTDAQGAQARVFLRYAPAYSFWVPTDVDMGAARFRRVPSAHVVVSAPI